MEIRLAKPILIERSFSTVKEIFLYIMSLKSGYPTLYILYKIILTISVSTAQCEHSFSTLNRIKTYLQLINV